MVKSSKLFLIHTSTPNYRRRRYKNRNKREKFLQLFFRRSRQGKPATNEVSNTKRFELFRLSHIYPVADKKDLILSFLFALYMANAKAIIRIYASVSLNVIFF